MKMPKHPAARAALIATIVLAPGGFILGATLIARRLNTRRHSQNDDPRENVALGKEIP